MRRIKEWAYFLILILHFYPYLGKAQANREISPSKIDQLKEQLDYSATEWSLKARQTEQEDKEEEIEPIAENSMIQLLLYLLILIVIILIILGLIYVFGSQSRDRDTRISQSSSDHIIPERIEDLKVLPLIEQALAEGDYRMALRLRFLEILKAYHEKAIIKWMPDKTNRDYLSELKDHNSRNPLSAVIQIYERSWYGHHEVSKELYEKYSPRFEALTQQISIG